MSSDYHKGFVLRALRKGEGYSDRWVEIAIGFVGRLGICHDAELVSLASQLGPKCRGAVTYKVTAKKRDRLATISPQGLRIKILGSGRGRSRLRSTPPISDIPHPGEAGDHHHPGRGFGNCAAASGGDFSNDADAEQSARRSGVPLLDDCTGCNIQLPHLSIVKIARPEVNPIRMQVQSKVTVCV